jgi:hypothetical protein
VREPSDLREYLVSLRDFDTDGVVWHLARTVVLEQFVALDSALNDVLAVHYARNQQVADDLVDNVLSHLSLDRRTQMLTSVLDECELTERWPFLPAVLPRLSKLRHALAHGFFTPLPGDRLQITAVNRGKTREFVYTARELTWLTWQAQVTWTELRSIWAVLVPDEDDWFGAEPPPGA